MSHCLGSSRVPPGLQGLNKSGKMYVILVQMKWILNTAYKCINNHAGCHSSAGSDKCVPSPLWHRLVWGRAWGLLEGVRYLRARQGLF